MPRGGSKDGNNSPLIGDNGVLATPSELTALTRNMIDNFVADLSRPKIDMHNPEQVKSAILGYLIDCEKSNKRPMNMGLYRALDLTRQDASDILRQRNKGRASPECIDMLKKALAMLAEYREQLGAKGKLNPVTLIFWQKNYDNLTDSQVIQISNDVEHRENMTPEQVQKQIEQDIPIDTDYTEK